MGKAERDDKIQGWEAKYVRGDKAEGSQVRNRNKPGGDQQNQFETFDAAPERELNTRARAWTDGLADALSPARSLARSPRHFSQSRHTSNVRPTQDGMTNISHLTIQRI